LYNPERPGQGRGFPTLSPVIARTRDLQLYEDAELARKNLEARLGALASGDVSQLAGAPLDLSGGSDPATAQKTGELGPLPSGGIMQLPEGMNIEMVEPKPAGGFVEYVKLNLHMIAAGMGVTYEMLLGDLTDVNFTSGRMGTMTVRRRYEMIQWLHLIPMLLERMWRAFIDALELDGKITSADYAVEWATPRWESVNPLEDAKTDQAELAAGLTSLSEKIRRRGEKPELVMKEIAADLTKLKELGVLDILLFLQRGNLPTQPANDGDGKSDPKAA
jgi:lambda family phage portal protein